MTGTPCPNDPTDAWALAKLVSPERVPKFFGGFKRQTMYQVSQFKWVPNAASLHHRLRRDAAGGAVQEGRLPRSAAGHPAGPPVRFDQEQRKSFEELKTTMQPSGQGREGHRGERRRQDRQAAPDPVRRDQGG
jgi:hypothetical protein